MRHDLGVASDAKRTRRIAFGVGAVLVVVAIVAGIVLARRSSGDDRRKSEATAVVVRYVTEMTANRFGAACALLHASAAPHRLGPAGCARVLAARKAAQELPPPDRVESSATVLRGNFIVVTI